MGLDVRQRLQIPRQPIKKQDPQARVHNWDEVSPAEMEFASRGRALHRCPTACQQACRSATTFPALCPPEQGDVVGTATVFRGTSNLRTLRATVRRKSREVWSPIGPACSAAAQP
jgi:hypothetical protein